VGIETEEETALIDAVEKKLEGPDLAEVMGSAIRGELSRESILRKVFNIEQIEPPKE